MPASSCSFTASNVASRLARASSSPLDFQGAHSVLGSASHSGLGSEPAIVVGNSMGASRSVAMSVLIERLYPLFGAACTFVRHARVCPGHPRLSYCGRNDVDARDIGE